MKILFCGYSRAGKDEAASYLAKITGLRYAGSFSWAALPYVAARMGLHPQVCWETRHQHRVTWYNYCNDLRVADPTILARMVLASGDITAGLRDRVELEAVKAAKLFDHIIWIDRDRNLVDPTVTFEARDCPEYFCNFGTLAEFHQKLAQWASFMEIPLI